ncbi:MAG: hypothetical protein ACREMZ_11400 [Gemmatimonadales bacterium]
MASQATTEATPVTFTLKEGPRGEPKVMIEENEPGLPVLRDGDAFLMIHFRKGVTFNQAEDFVRQMRRMLDVLTYTKFTP